MRITKKEELREHVVSPWGEAIESAILLLIAILIWAMIAYIS